MEKNWKEERLKNKKEIYFVLDTFEYLFISMPTIDCYSYLDTEEAIKCGCKRIRTYDLLHLSFDLLELGYRIYLVKDAKVLEVYPGMDNFSNKDIRFGHNLRRLLLGGFFDSMLDIDRNKFWYDKSMSTTDLCQQEENFQKSLFNFTLNTALKTMGVDIKGVKAMSDEESYEWHKKHSKIDPKTGNLIISDDEIGDGTFEKQYPKL